MRHVVFLTVLTVAGSGLGSAQPTDPAAILERSRETYAKLPHYEIRAITGLETKTADFEQSTKTRLLVAASGAGKFRIEQRGAGGFLKISDGVSMWVLQGFLKQYLKTVAGETISAALASSPAAMLAPPGPDDYTSPRLLDGEDVSVQGMDRPCYVVEIQEKTGKPAPTKSEQRLAKLWIDKETYLILKRVAEHRIPNFPPTGQPADMRMTLHVESMTLHRPPAAELFAFTPPEGARMVNSFEYPGMKKSEITGKPAPDFTLRDLAGQEVTLAGLRGKTIVLNFWTTWCGPCRAEIPLLRKIHEEEESVALFAVNVGEDSGLVRKFVDENKVTYPVLLAGSDKTPDLYDARSFPTTVVIDRNGIVRSHKTGYGPGAEQELRAALREAASPSAARPTPTESAGMAVHSVGNGVSAPQLTWKREPEYTDEARRARISGSVLLDAIISAEGIPVAVSVRRGLAEDLDQRAVEAVKSWRFRPASKDGKPVAVRTTIETHFRLMSAPHMPQPTEEPRSAEDAYRYGVRLARERRLDAAAPMFSQAIAMKPDWPQAWAARARIAYQDKRYVDSIKDLDEALRLDPTNPVWYDARGLAYSHSGQHARAIEDYNRAIELSSMAPASYYNNRGWALNETGHPEKAIADLTRALNIEPGYQVAYENRALASYRLKEYGRAIADYSAALQINPTKWQYEKRAEAKRAAGDFTGADEDIRKAAEFRESPPPP